MAHVLTFLRNTTKTDIAVIVQLTSAKYNLIRMTPCFTWDRSTRNHIKTMSLRIQTGVHQKYGRVLDE